MIPQIQLHEFINQLYEWWMTHGWNIVVILIVMWIFRLFGGQLVMQVLKKTVRSDLYPTQSDREKRLKTLNSLVSAAFHVGVLITATVMILQELGIKTGPLLASAGFLGLALGFGAQSLIKDIVTGIFIIMENQYRVGDIVTIGAVSGKVEAITIRVTVLRDLSGHVHHVPNGQINVTTNKSMDYSNINLDLAFHQRTDIKLLECVINESGEKLAKVENLKTIIVRPPHFERIKELGSNGLIIKIMGKTAPDKANLVTSELFKLLQSEFNKHDILLHNQQPDPKR